MRVQEVSGLRLGWGGGGWIWGRLVSMADMKSGLHSMYRQKTAILYTHQWISAGRTVELVQKQPPPQ